MYWKMQNSITAALVLTCLSVAILAPMAVLLVDLGVTSDVAAYGGGALGALSAYLICCQIFPGEQ